MRPNAAPPDRLPPILAVVAPLIVPYDAENFFDYDSLNARPSAKHWFGVDNTGRDLLSRLKTGQRIPDEGETLLVEYPDSPAARAAPARKSRARLGRRRVVAFMAWVLSCAAVAPVIGG